MNETICNIMLYGGISLAIIFAIVAVILFVRLDIPKVVGDLTGYTAKKKIKEIREKGYESIQGSGASKQEAIKAKTSSGKISVRDIKPDKEEENEISRKGNELYNKAISELKNTNTEEDYERETDVLNVEEDYERETDVLSAEEDYERETDILSSEEDYEHETDILSSEEDYKESTDILSSEDYEQETNILTMPEDEDEATDVLAVEDEDATDVLNTNINSNGFVILTDIVVVHTEESI